MESPSPAADEDVDMYLPQPQEVLYSIDLPPVKLIDRHHRSPPELI